jgi:L-threonylcarbamoyladenylate synthase
VRKVFAAKGRPHDHLLIVHLADAAQVANWARAVPDAAHVLARRFWPGPLTVILTRAAGVSDLVTGGQDTIAVRVPSHPVAQALLRKFGDGIARPQPTGAYRRRPRSMSATALAPRSIACWMAARRTSASIDVVDLSGAQPTLLRRDPLAYRSWRMHWGRRPLPDASPRAPARWRGTTRHAPRCW